jgi:Putative serine esterase (DUF676)
MSQQVKCCIALRLIACAAAALGCAANALATTCPSPADISFTGNSPGGYLSGRGPDKDRVIVFVNGIFGDAVSTWMNDDCAYWPTLLAADHAFDDADIYVHSFQSPQLAQAQQIIELAARFRDLLEVDGVLRHKQMVFLVHSMGGLVTRAMLVNARPPASLVPMIFFFATPSGGADIAGIASHLSENPQLKDMLPLEAGGYVKDLFEEWLQISGDPRLNYPNSIASYCASEIQKTWGVLIVPEISADLLCNRETRAVNANHIGIVKPRDDRDDPYIYFKAAYLQTFSGTAQAIASTIETRLINAQFAFDHGVPITTEQGIPITSSQGIPITTGQGQRFQLTLVQSKATSTHIDVPCEEMRQGELRTQIALKPTERVIYVRPAIANSVNVKSSWAAVVDNSNGAAVVHYSLQGLDRQPFNCPAGGHADVIVNYVVEQEANGMQ